MSPSPSELNPPIAQSSTEPIIHLSYRDGNGVFHADWPITRVEEAIDDKAGLAVGRHPGPDEHARSRAGGWLCRNFHFHHLAVEDALRESHIAKVDDWGDYLYIVFHVAGIEPESDKLDLHELDIFLGPNYLITYHTAPLAILDQDRAEHRARPRDRLRHGADHLLYPVSRAGDRPVAGRDRGSRRAGRRRSRTPCIENATPRIAAGRSSGSSERPSCCTRLLSPQREVLNRLARDPYRPVQPKHRVYFRDLYDHVVRIHDISESLRDLIAGALETYLSVVSNRTNDIMKTLTIVTVMFMPMSFLVGFFGMNFFGETLAFTKPMPRALLFWGERRDHGDIALLHLDLRAAAEMVLSAARTAPQLTGQGPCPDERPLADQAARSGRIESLSRSAGISPLVAQLLHQSRDRRPRAGRRVPRSQDGQPARPRAAARRRCDAAERIVRAIREDRKIVIYGDYDVDGVCGTSVLWACLRLAGATQRRILHPAPRRRGLRRQCRRPAPAGRGEQGRGDRDGRLRHLGGRARPSWRASWASS